MNAIAPPASPVLVTCDEGEPDRLKLRLRQLSWTTVTVAATAWFCTFGVVATVLALCVAKHVLVAILVMGLGVDSARRAAVD